MHGELIEKPVAVVLDTPPVLLLPTSVGKETKGEATTEAAILMTTNSFTETEAPIPRRVKMVDQETSYCPQFSVKCLDRIKDASPTPTPMIISNESTRNLETVL